MTRTFSTMPTFPRDIPTSPWQSRGDRQLPLGRWPPDQKSERTQLAQGSLAPHFGQHLRSREAALWVKQHVVIHGIPAAQRIGQGPFEPCPQMRNTPISK